MKRKRPARARTITEPTERPGSLQIQLGERTLKMFVSGKMDADAVARLLLVRYSQFVLVLDGRPLAYGDAVLMDLRDERRLTSP